ncbi:MAG: hypothetical protein ACT4OI_07110 [Methanobacteriota archaeon]
MGTLIELLANRTKPAPPTTPAAEPAPVVLPMLSKAHEGGCGDGCGCADGADGGGCCSP